MTSTFAIDIMSKESFLAYNHKGRYGYICKVTKPVLSISTKKCAIWFNKNHRNYFTRRFIMVTETKADAIVLYRHMKEEPALKNCQVHYVKMEEAAEAAPEKGVSKLHALTVIPF